MLPQTELGRKTLNASHHDCGMEERRPLRILHVMDSLGEGGAEQNLLTLVQQLGRDQAVHGLAWLYDDDQLREAFRPHVATMVALHTGRYLGMLPAAVRLARAVREFKPDLLHAKLISGAVFGATRR